MKALNPFERDLDESQEIIKDLSAVAKQTTPPTDERLESYVRLFWEEYRRAVEKLFPSIAMYLPLYRAEAYQTTVLRLGGFFVVFAHNPSEASSIRVAQPEDVGIETREFNILKLPKQLPCTHLEWFGVPRPYTDEAARLHAVQTALHEALGYFWQFLKPENFESLCVAMIAAEGVGVTSASDHCGPDACGVAELQEPGGFRRKEQWVFEFKHHQTSRATPESVAQLAELLGEKDGHEQDIACLLTSGDLTSIATRIASDHPRVRIWDRPVLDALLHKHPEILSKHFADYATALADPSRIDP